MSYSADTFVADEIPTTAKWNKLWNNDASFNDGTGIGAGAIGTSAIATGIQLPDKMKNPYKFLVYRNAAQSCTAGSYTKLNFDAKAFDTGSNFDNATNFRFTAPIAGFYRFSGNACITNTQLTLGLYKNGTVYKQWANDTSAMSATASRKTTSFSTLLQLAASDYIEVFAFCASITAFEVGGTPIITYLAGELVSAT